MESLKGKLLIANGNLFGDTFRQTVILMAEHDEDGALGFVLNQPSEVQVDRAAVSSRLQVVDDVLYVGGPVHPHVFAVLAEFPGADVSTRLIFDAVGFVPFDSDPGPVTRARIFAGYSGWGPGQLEGEMEENSWIVAPATANLVFGDPSDMWQLALKALGGEYALLATMPYDPGMN